jgi:hypothetical protein
MRNNTWRTRKDGAVSKVDKKFISHSSWAQHTGILSAGRISKFLLCHPHILEKYTILEWRVFL